MDVYCRICNNLCKTLFEKPVLKKYQTKYYQCINCGFIQTETPYWLEEAYVSAITSIDIGLLYRNMYNLPVTSAIIYKYFNSMGKFIDYGGGYGIFTRLMRDKGFEYFRQDIYCDNIFARHFDVTELNSDNKFEMLTAFEVFEHLPDTQKGLEEMLNYSNNIFFSTLLVPPGLTDSNWWYFSPETGQHVSFYSKKSLAILAKRNKLNFYSNNVNLHLFTTNKINPSLFRLLTRYKAAKLYCHLRGNRKSLLNRDFEYLKSLLK